MSERKNKFEDWSDSKRYWAVGLFQYFMGCLFFSAGYLLCGDVERWQALAVGCLFILVWCELFMSREM